MADNNIDESELQNTPEGGGGDPGKGKNKAKEDKFTWGDAGILAVLIIGIVLVRIFVIAPYRVPSESMEPTVATGSYIIGSKTSDPHKGDVVVFTNEDWGETNYVKRIVAIEGDTVGGCDSEGRLLVNRKPVFEDYVDGNTGCNFPEIVVPEGRVWVMGDNRLNSADSRYHTFGSGGGADVDAGTIDKDNIEAVVTMNVGLTTLHRVK